MPDFGLSAVLGGVRAATGLLGRTRAWLGHRIRFFQPSLAGGPKHTFFPPDFLAKAKLGAKRSKIEAMLGEPDQATADRWAYSYKEVHLQLGFEKDQGSLQSIVLGFAGRWHKDKIKVDWLEERLGELNLAQAAAYSRRGLADLEFEQGRNYTALKLEAHIGPLGAGQYLTFGVLIPPAGALAEPPRFECDYLEKRLVSQPEEVLVNWVGISSNWYDDNWFDWSATIPSH